MRLQVALNNIWPVVYSYARWQTKSQIQVQLGRRFRQCLSDTLAFVRNMHSVPCIQFCAAAMVHGALLCFHSMPGVLCSYNAVEMLAQHHAVGRVLRVLRSRGGGQKSHGCRMDRCFCSIGLLQEPHNLALRVYRQNQAMCSGFRLR